MVNIVYTFHINLRCSSVADPVLLFWEKTFIIMRMRTEFRHFLTQS